MGYSEPEEDFTHHTFTLDHFRWSADGLRIKHTKIVVGGGGLERPQAEHHKTELSYAFYLNFNIPNNYTENIKISLLHNEECDKVCTSSRNRLFLKQIP